MPTTMLFFRAAVLIMLVMQFVWFFAPWGVTYENGAEEAMVWAGINSYVSTNASIFVSDSVAMLYVVAYVGLLFFRPWARGLFVAVCAFSGLSVFLNGLSIQSNYEAALSYFMTLADGAIIALSYCSIVRDGFGSSYAD